MCVMMLYGPFSFIFILTEPLTVKKENISSLFHNFLHCGMMESFCGIPCSRDTLSLILSFVMLVRFRSDGFNHLYSLFFSHDMFTILPTRKLTDGSITLFFQTMTCLDPLLHCFNTNMLKHPTDCWL